MPRLSGCISVISRILLLTVLPIYISGCEKSEPNAKNTQLIYFGFDGHNETPEDVLRMAKEWGNPAPCSNLQVTIKKEEADYQILFGTADMTLIDRRGRLIFTGGIGVLYLPHGNPDGSGVNLCKMMDEEARSLDLAPRENQKQN